MYAWFGQRNLIAEWASRRVFRSALQASGHKKPVNIRSSYGTKGQEHGNCAGEAETMKIAKETWIIMAIGVADLATTILFIQHHGAHEANPLFKRYWEMGLTVFIAAKCALLVGPLVVLEWARRRNPHFVSWALRSAIAAYVVMYGVGYMRLNQPPKPEQEYTGLAAPTIPMPSRLAARIQPAMPTSRVRSKVTGPQNVGGAVTVF